MHVVMQSQKGEEQNRNSTYGANVLTLSLPRVINVKFLLQPHQKYYITHAVRRAWLFIAYSDER